MPGVNAEENGGSEGMMVTNGRNGGGAGDGQQQAPRKSKVRCKKSRHLKITLQHIDKHMVQSFQPTCMGGAKGAEVSEEAFER